MINNISIFCNISESKCHKLVNIDSSNGFLALHNRPFHSIVLQKRIIRMIMGAKPRDHTEPMFLKLGLLKFVDVNKYLIAVFMHGYHNARIPDMFIDYFKRIQDVHHYATQSCSGLYAMQVKTDLGKTGISNIGPIIWNKILSVGINPDISECVFSKSLKTCIKTNLF